MPNAKTHKAYSMKYLGSYNPFLNKIIDAPCKQMKHNHRLLFHDYKFVQYVESVYGPDAALEVLLHIVVDIESMLPDHKRLVRL